MLSKNTWGVKSVREAVLQTGRCNQNLYQLRPWPIARSYFIIYHLGFTGLVAMFLLYRIDINTDDGGN